MLTLDRGHLAATHRRPSSWTRKCATGVRRSRTAPRSAGSVAELVQSSASTATTGRRPDGPSAAVKQALARLMQPFFKPQVRYNLIVAEHLGRIEVALDGASRRDRGHAPSGHDGRAIRALPRFGPIATRR